MTPDSLLNEDWSNIVDRLGGAEALSLSARASNAFRRGRVIPNAITLLRLVLAYCLGSHGLRGTAAWASASGLTDISNVALLYRLRQCGDWLNALIGQLLSSAAPKPSRGRFIRILDGSAVAQAGADASANNKLWRIHAAFDLPSERFGFFELTDQHEAERLDRVPVVKGEIRLADRVYLKPDRMATVLAAGADLVVRAGWRSARWLEADATPVNLPRELRKAAKRGLIDRKIWLGRKNASPLALRMVAIKKPEPAAAAARRKARREAQRERYQISTATLIAAGWVILITSLQADDWPAQDVMALYRLRWRVELGFKRLKSLVGLHGPPATDARSARPWVLAHLLMILLLEPLVDELEDSPRWACAA
jgi:Transposase DDE domain